MAIFKAFFSSSIFSSISLLAFEKAKGVTAFDSFSLFNDKLFFIFSYPFFIDSKSAPNFSFIVVSKFFVSSFNLFIFSSYFFSSPVTLYFIWFNSNVKFLCTGDILLLNASSIIWGIFFSMFSLFCPRVFVLNEKRSFCKVCNVDFVFVKSLFNDSIFLFISSIIFLYSPSNFSLEVSSFLFLDSFLFLSLLSILSTFFSVSFIFSLVSELLSFSDTSFLLSVSNFFIWYIFISFFAVCELIWFRYVSKSLSYCSLSEFISFFLAFNLSRSSGDDAFCNFNSIISEANFIEYFFCFILSSFKFDNSLLKFCWLFINADNTYFNNS